jgi:hypothetical protein
MTPEQFCYWLQGFMEVGYPTSIDAAQIEIIRDHLDLVFEKVTPNRDIREVRACAPSPNFMCVTCGWIGHVEGEVVCGNPTCTTPKWGQTVAAKVDHGKWPFPTQTVCTAVAHGTTDPKHIRLC